VSNHDTEIVSALRAALADKVGKSRFEVWFGDAVRLQPVGDTLVVGLPNPLLLDFIRATFHTHLRQACAAVLGRTLRLEFCVDPPDAKRRSATRPNGQQKQRGGSRKRNRSSSADPGGRSRRANATGAFQAELFPQNPPQSTGDAAGLEATGAQRRQADAEQNPTSREPQHEAQPAQLAQPGGAGAATQDRALRLAADSQSASNSRAGALSDQPATKPDSASDAAAEAGPQASARAVNGSRRRKRLLETYVSGPTNRLAVASAEMVVHRPGQLSPLLIHGPTGVGKTHLLEGILHATRRRWPAISAVYLTAEQFTTLFLEALRGSGLPNFRRKYRGVGLLIVDDLHFLAGKRATLVELLHTIDTLLRQGRQLVFAADRAPTELEGLGVELAARLQSGMVCQIEPPDFDTRLGILRQMAQAMGLTLPEEVAALVASRLTSHARELSGALCRLRATSVALQRPISLELAEEALAEMFQQSVRAVHLHDIEKAVCEVFGVEPASLHSETRSQHVSHPRMLAMWLARKHTRAALSEIGRFFGRRSHSTVISATRRVDDWMAAGRSLQLKQRTCRVDEAIRQVERRLRCG